jgi:hypothetical protein
MYMWMVKRKDPQHHKQIRVCMNLPSLKHYVHWFELGYFTYTTVAYTVIKHVGTFFNKRVDTFFNNAGVKSLNVTIWHINEWYNLCIASGVSSAADNPEVPAGHAQGDSGVAAPFGGLGPIVMS